ncbi:MAG: HAD-IA family hydrolase [Clostridiales bacterium]|nr:HAD-IA family hydrolase [Clostridiales bacterium]
MKNTVIFDLDGTLLNTLEDLRDAVNFAMRSCSFPERTFEEVRRFVGNGVRMLVKRAVPENTSEEDFEKAYSFFREYYKENMENHTRPYDGVCEMLESLKNNGIKTAIVTNKADFAAIPLCKRMFPQVDVVIGVSSEIVPKPDPCGVYKALEMLGSKGEDAYYVGDSEVDAETARNSGLELICVLWGFRSKNELEKLGLDRFISTPDELLKLLKA